MIIQNTVLITGPIKASTAFIEVQVSAPVAILDILEPVKVLSAGDV